MSVVVVDLNREARRDRLARPRVRTDFLAIDRGVCSVVIEFKREPADLAQLQRPNLELASERQVVFQAINLNFGLDTVNSRIGRNFFQWLARVVAPLRKLVILSPEILTPPVETISSRA